MRTSPDFALPPLPTLTTWSANFVNQGKQPTRFALDPDYYSSPLPPIQQPLTLFVAPGSTQHLSLRPNPEGSFLFLFLFFFPLILLAGENSKERQKKITKDNLVNSFAWFSLFVIFRSPGSVLASLILGWHRLLPTQLIIPVFVCGFESTQSLRHNSFCSTTALDLAC